MRVVVVGKGGQLASELQSIMETDKNWFFLSEQELDITDMDVVLRYFSKLFMILLLTAPLIQTLIKQKTKPSLVLM